METAHLYNLKVIWSNRPSWNIDILAINAECCSMWLQDETEKDYIVSISIELKQRNYSKEKESFLAKGLN